MAEQGSDANNIRNKRLAKLGSQTSQSDSTAPEQTSSHSESVLPTKQPQASNPPKGPSTTNSLPESHARKSTSITHPSSPQSRISKESQERRASPVQSRTSPNPPAPTKQRIEEWEDQTIRAFFKVTLDPGKKQDVNGRSLHFLGDMRSEHDNSQRPPRLSKDSIEDIILDAGSHQDKIGPLKYLLACWKRIVRTWRSLKAHGAEETKLGIVKEARRLCLSYCFIAVNMPEIFGREEPPESFTPHLLLEQESEHGIDPDFLSEAVSRFDDDESIKEALVNGMEGVSRALSKKTMNDDYKPCVLALQTAAQYPPLVKALAESPNFAPAHVPAQSIEKDTFLGPFFSISPMQGEVALNFFSNPRTQDRRTIVNSQNALRMTLQTHQGDLFNIINRFIKLTKESREKTLDWLALCVNSNHKRRALRPDYRFVASDGFMVNVTVCLDMLSEPFMDASFTKINRIEPEYFRRSPRVKIQDETKLNADQATSDAFYAQKALGESNFISEIFFLTVAAHHYGSEAANTKLDGLRKDLRHMEKQLESFKEERQKFLGNPVALKRFDEAFQKHQREVDRGYCVAHSIEGVALDELSQARSMSFMRYVIVWLMRLVSGVDFPKQFLSLPLPPREPEVFKCLPEYFLEDIVDHFKFITSHMPHVVSPTQCDELVMICITFLRCSDYIRNPYLKSGLVSILFYGIYQAPRSPKGILGDVLNSMPFATGHLLHALMQQFIECESTGGHNQFYDKFNIRYEIFQVIKTVWDNPIYRDNLAKEAKVNFDFFVRFVNLMTNDVTYVLDELFTSFNKISSLERELKNSRGSMDEATKTEKEETLEEAEKKAKSYMQLTTDHLITLKMFTQALPDQFTSPEIVQRLADMLDYNLDTLVGPKRSQLAVDNKDQYGFRPRELLSDLIDVYLHLRAKRNFHKAIARDGRSYKPENFDEAERLIWGKGAKASMDLRKWKSLGDAVKKAKADDEAEEEDLGEPPDEFTDPLMATLMDDPVTLPVSRAVMDLSTIRQHLLSDPHDPFNRAPLKIEDVIPNVELKEQIDGWKRERKAARRAQQTDGDVMDTSEG